MERHEFLIICLLLILILANTSEGPWTQLFWLLVGIILTVVSVSVYLIEKDMSRLNGGS